MFDYHRRETISEREERILKFWNENTIFEKSLDPQKPLFSFYDGPPFATGLPHYGHLVAGTLKDVIPRYKTMKGYFVPRRFGWDCHGLPVENEIEKAKALSGEEYVSKFGIKSFNEECFSIVLRYTKEWESTVLRMGRWVDFNHSYRTMDIDFMESVWWVFKKLYEMGLIYEGYKVMPFSAKLGTPLSNFEANLNYKEVDDPSLTVLFHVEDEDCFFMAWTTTPWTLISNLALTVRPDAEYVMVEKEGKRYIIAKERMGFYFKDERVIKTYLGKELEGKHYRPLFNYFLEERERGAFRIIGDDFVTMEDGTGIVHTAPAFGEMDFYACKKADIEPVCPVDKMGRFTSEVKEFEGVYVKDADKHIIKRLKSEGKVFSHSQIRHRYPFCWRTDTPLIYKAVKTWFLSVEKIKDRLIEANKKINWVPSHIKEGRFGKWLENARDWAISRNRYWGTPLPIFRSEDGEILVVGSVKELEEMTRTKVNNLHRQFIDDLVIEKDGKKFRRIEEVFDCWFESGSMPYGQNHYPFERKSETEKGFPADFIAEGLDQTRGWFYTLNVLSTALFDEPAFKNVIVNGIVLTENGTKMSKRLKNYPEPKEVIDKYGADAIRLYLMGSNVVKAEDLCFSSKGVELVLRQVLIPFWNSFIFLSTYASIYKWEPGSKNQTSYLDRWILSLLNGLIHEVTEALESYELDKATLPLTNFVDQLTNWYIRRSRPRFWADDDTPDRRAAFETLYTVLLTLSKVAAPFMPFIAEEIYQQLKDEKMALSVHLNAFPEIGKRDLALEREMHFVQKAVSLGHGLRKERKVKVRQPLKEAKIAAKKEILEYVKRQKELIMDELNVKEITFFEDEGELVLLSAKPNFPILGKRLQKDLPLAKTIILNLSQQDLKRLKEKGKLDISLSGREEIILAEEVIFEHKVKEGLVAGSDGEITLAIDFSLNEELVQEGFAREIVNKLNTMRKDLDFEITDRIRVSMKTSSKVKDSFLKFYDYIVKEVLAVEVKFEDCEGEEIDINGEKSVISIKRL